LKCLSTTAFGLEDRMPAVTFRCRLTMTGDPKLTGEGEEGACARRVSLAPIHRRQLIDQLCIRQLVIPTRAGGDKPSDGESLRPVAPAGMALSRCCSLPFSIKMTHR
jgi:hypothetical protein